jgi:hypothetical protein
VPIGFKRGDTPPRPRLQRGDAIVIEPTGLLKPRPRRQGEAARRLRRRVEALGQLIEGHERHIDTIQILTGRIITLKDREELLRLSGKVTWPWHNKKQWKYGIRIHQPSQDAIRYVQDRLPDHTVTRFDVAVDFYSRSDDDASSLKKLLFLSVTQPWRGHRKITTMETAHYFARAWQRRNIVLYLKNGPRPATRLELRYFSAAVCRMRAVSKAADLLHWEPANFLDRDIKLSVIDWDKADKLIAAEAREIEQRHNSIGQKSGFGRAAIRRNLQDMLCHHISPDGDAPASEDRANFPAQVCVDALPFLRSALVTGSASTLINTHESQNRL